MLREKQRAAALVGSSAAQRDRSSHLDRSRDFSRRVVSHIQVTLGRADHESIEGVLPRDTGAGDCVIRQREDAGHDCRIPVDVEVVLQCILPGILGVVAERQLDLATLPEARDVFAIVVAVTVRTLSESLRARGEGDAEHPTDRHAIEGEAGSVGEVLGRIATLRFVRTRRNQGSRCLGVESLRSQHSEGHCVVWASIIIEPREDGFGREGTHAQILPAANHRGA